MPTATKQCRVCGKSYEACRSLKVNVDGPFRWQEVACSPECGAEYLRRVNESRNPTPKTKRGLRAKVAVVDEAIDYTLVVESASEESAQEIVE